MAMYVIFGGQSVFEHHGELSDTVFGAEFFDSGVSPHQQISTTSYITPTPPAAPHLEVLYTRASVQSIHNTASVTDFEESYSECPVRMADFIPDIHRCHQTCHEDFVDAGIKTSTDKESLG